MCVGCASVTIYVRSCVPTSVCVCVCVRACVCVCVHVLYVCRFLVCVRAGLVCNQMFGWLSYSPICNWIALHYCKLNQGLMNLIKTCWLRSKNVGRAFIQSVENAENNTSHSALTSTVQLPVMYCIIYATCVCLL